MCQWVPRELAAGVALQYTVGRPWRALPFRPSRLPAYFTYFMCRNGKVYSVPPSIDITIDITNCMTTRTSARKKSTRRSYIAVTTNSRAFWEGAPAYVIKYYILWDIHHSLWYLLCKTPKSHWQCQWLFFCQRSFPTLCGPRPYRGAPCRTLPFMPYSFLCHGWGLVKNVIMVHEVQLKMSLWYSYAWHWCAHSVCTAIITHIAVRDHYTRHAVCRKYTKC